MFLDVLLVKSPVADCGRGVNPTQLTHFVLLDKSHASNHGRGMNPNRLNSGFSPAKNSGLDALLFKTQCRQDLQDEQDYFH
jgi:hypothetical protein